jgi:chemotaxis protein histidine kinase CheA
MELDQELKDDFIKEVNELKKELKVVVDRLILNHKQPPLYKEFGQKIDRIYGTAITLGFTEFGKYAKAMKDVSYMCGNSDSEMGQKKVVNMMSTCLESFDILCKGIEEPKLLKGIAANIAISIQKVGILEKTYFTNVKDKKTV